MSRGLHILIVDDDPMMAKTLVDILKIQGYEAIAAHSGADALKKLDSNAFDCVLSDIKMPEINGVDLYQAIKARHPNMPVVLMTAYSADSLIKQGLEQGVIAVLTKPVNIEALLAFLSFLRKERSVVIVDDDPRFCRVLGDILQLQGFSVVSINEPADILHEVPEALGLDALHSAGVFPIVVLDMKLNGITGLVVLQKIRALYPDLTVILVTGYRTEMASAIEAALKLGACTCLYKPLEYEQLFELLKQIHHHELGRMLREYSRREYSRRECSRR